MNEQEAFEIVFNRLKENPLFCGKYDAVHGNEDFMYGISTVMEYITYMIDDETGISFDREFYDNMVASKEKAKNGI